MRRIKKKYSYTALEFFSGIGLSRAGMEAAGIKTVWSNDYDSSKREMYSQQWGSEGLVGGDINKLSANVVPTADIAWSSSPCTDLSVAGKQAGILSGRESSAFLGFTRVIREMGQYKPSVLVLENVIGLATSHGGEDFRIVLNTFNELGYAVDAVELDARRWIAQSRPRMFVVGMLNPTTSGTLDTSIRPDRLSWIHNSADYNTFLLDGPEPPKIKTTGFSQLAEKLSDDDSRWWDENRVTKALSSMSDINLRRLKDMSKSDTDVFRTAYRRTRGGIPRWEIRADDIAGCLRTVRGGSSKQAVFVSSKGKIRARWLTGQEYANLQGAPWYNLNNLKDSQIYFGFGDAVAVPAVAWLMKEMVVPALDASENSLAMRG
jgi:DNA (cytosine-5)-methyltransferase 1